jgi:hypothetical protein
MARTARRFAQIDVNYFDDDRVLEAGPACVLHLAAILACKSAPSDGVLTRRQLTRIAPESIVDVPEAIRRLIRVGLFEDTGEVIVIRSWFHWNDSTEEIEAMSKKGLEGNHVRWHVKRNIIDPACSYCIGGRSGGDIAPNPHPNRRLDTDTYTYPDLDSDSNSLAHVNSSNGSREGMSTFGAEGLDAYLEGLSA